MIQNHDQETVEAFMTRLVNQAKKDGKPAEGMFDTHFIADVKKGDDPLVLADKFIKARDKAFERFTEQFQPTLVTLMFPKGDDFFEAETNE